MRIGSAAKIELLGIRKLLLGVYMIWVKALSYYLDVSNGIGRILQESLKYERNTQAVMGKLFYLLTEL